MLGPGERHSQVIRLELAPVELDSVEEARLPYGGNSIPSVQVYGLVPPYKTFQNAHCTSAASPGARVLRSMGIFT